MPDKTHPHNVSRREALSNPLGIFKRIMHAMQAVESPAPDSPAQVDNAERPSGIRTSRRHFLATTGAAAAITAAAPTLLTSSNMTAAATSNAPCLGKLIAFNAPHEASAILLNGAGSIIEDAVAWRNMLRDLCGDFTPDQIRAACRSCGEDAIEAASQKTLEYVREAGRTNITLADCRRITRERMNNLVDFCDAVASASPDAKTQKEKDSTKKEQSSEQPPDAMKDKQLLSLAVDICHLGLEWKPEKKRLIFTRPPLGALFGDYALQFAADGSTIETAASTMKLVEKMAARDDIMRDIKELVLAEYPGAAVTFSNTSGIMIDNPPPEMFRHLEIDSAVATKRNMDAGPERG